MANAANLQWSTGAKLHGLTKCDPGRVRVYMAKLESEGELTKERVRKDAERANNPLHHGTGWFFGADEEAAERWRLQVASSAISGLVSVTISKEDGKEVSLPEFVQTGKHTGRGRGEEHKSLELVMAHVQERAEYLVRLLRDMNSLDRQYAALLSHYPKIRQKWAALREQIEAELPPS